MAFRTNDRVKETSTTTGTGNLTLLGAVSGFQAFSVFANNDTFLYAIVHQTAAEWEVGIGTYVSATPALARTTVLESSNGDALVSFSAGTKDVFVDRPSAMTLQMEERAAPDPAEANWISTYAFDNGAEAQVRTRGEYGLIDILSQRDRQRSRKDFLITIGSDSASATDIMFVGISSTVVSEGTITNLAATSAEGEAKNFLTGAVATNDAGILGSFTQTNRNKNPDITIKFRVNSTTQRRVWIGWFESDPMGADSAATLHKFGLRLSTIPAVTGFTIVHSDGTTETVEAQIQASDANVHTIRLIADNANSRWGYSFDGAAVVWITANIPTATQLMGFVCQIRTNEAVAKNMDFWFAEGSMEK